MGNQPSGPAPGFPAAPSAAPPVTVCDADCQRQNMITGLKTTLDQKELTKDQDPEGYEQARIAYYTAVNGQGWLANEKKRIADTEIKPVMTTYTNNYKALQDEQKRQQVFANLAAGLKAQEAGQEEDLRFLDKQLQQKRDETNVANRLAYLQRTTDAAPAPQIASNLTTVYEVMIAFIGLVIVYLLYSKFGVIKKYIGASSPAVPVGGKRLPH